MTAPDGAPDERTTPGALRLAASLVAVQGLALLGLGVVGLLDQLPAGRGVGASVAVFIGGYGVALLACARALTRRRAWARGPVLLTQLIQLGIAWNTRENLLLAVPLAATAAVVVVAMLQPATVDALHGEGAED
jgi:hypothetical protein